MPVVNNRVTLSIALFAGFAALAVAADDARFIPGSAASYPTKQTNDKVTVAAVPFATEDQAKMAFGKLDPNKYGILPVLIVIQNDSAQAIRVDSIKVEYVTPDRSRIESVPGKELQYLSGLRMPTIQNSPLPTGAPRVSRKKNPLSDPVLDVRSFSARMLPPGEKASGFFYFETVNRRGSTVYINGIREASSGKELFYFEIPLSEDGTH